MNTLKLSFREFNLLAMLCDQTNIVTFLLKNESNIDLEECFFNRYDVTVTLSSGRTIMSSSNYYDLVNKNGIAINELLLQKQDLKAKGEDTTTLQIELDGLIAYSLIYEEAAFKERFVFEWRLIPYWLADQLICQGETVLRAYGNDWWGVIDIAKGILGNESLQVVWNNLNSDST